jgi:predicted MFS family arabinose efflux permease
VLGVLTLVLTLNYLDRCLMLLLLQPIKVDLRLSDTQLGFLTGIAFGVFYATVGVPIARRADRGNRVHLTSLAIGLWGLTVMACVRVQNFTQLACARIAAAVGEAGCMPPTYSLLGDYFPGAAERPRAMAVYWLASPLSALVSFIVGGKLSELYGWRKTFLIFGIPGFVTAAIVWLTVREPRASAPPPSRLFEPSLRDVLNLLWRQDSSRRLCIALVLLLTMAYGLAPWYAAFMMRSHLLSVTEVGFWFGLIFGASGIVGTLLGGHLAGGRFANKEGNQMRLCALTVGALFPCFLLFLLLPSKGGALASLVPLLVIFNIFLGPTFSLLQRLVPEEMRATALAVVMLLANLIGMGLGPEVVGFLSDQLRPALGSDSLRFAMLAVSLIALWAAFQYWAVGRTLERDLGSGTQMGASRVSGVA